MKEGKQTRNSLWIFQHRQEGGNKQQVCLQWHVYIQEIMDEIKRNRKLGNVAQKHEGHYDNKSQHSSGGIFDSTNIFQSM